MQESKLENFVFTAGVISIGAGVIAGEYSVVSMIGKIIFFVGASISGAMFPLSSERFFKNKKMTRITSTRVSSRVNLTSANDWLIEMLRSYKISMEIEAGS